MLWERGKAYSQDLRERVFVEADDGAEVGEIATILRVSVSYVSKVLDRRRRTGETAARPQRCQLKPKLAVLHETIRAWVKEHPDATIGEVQAWLLRSHQVSASSGLICETLALLGLTRKKSRCVPPSRTARMWLRHEATGGRANETSTPRG
jgi:transposase